MTKVLDGRPLTGHATRASTEPASGFGHTAGIVDADLDDAEAAFEVAVRHLWREIKRVNRCTRSICTDLKGPNCECYNEFAAHLSWGFDEHVRYEAVGWPIITAQGMAARSDETPQEAQPERQQPDREADAPKGGPQ